MFPHSFTEILVIILVFVLLFKAKDLPEIGRSLGAGLRNFKKALSGEDDRIKEVKGEEKSQKKE
ncbi:Sec-independent protein translocase subunit TatA/TatB [Thermocrinis minervae]|uniref:Sec-independent protein translocase protein TatA n=1 Tax=Thermocrinis minervae TaxID=381751 RepID=A0A1M6SMW0_9AQUI|nr:twin-arginine translocase TatA/TatE family subunit [Thermocrinis minervae]SHK45976.1 sec-independent protein translocase protein TatA [Thermocrinis minervae]